MTLMCGACSPSTAPGLTVWKTKRLSRIGAGAEAAEAAEALVRAARVGGMGVAALRIGLPDLDHGVGDRLARAVEHAPDDADALARARGRRRDRRRRCR